MNALEAASDYSHLPFEQGRTRRVYIDNDWVYKVAVDTEGALANCMESEQYEYNVSNPDKVFIPVAECYLLDDGVLKMRRVEICEGHRYADMPSWVQSVDCAQVGYVGGELVAFDL